jgi:cyclopropane-fatty-acyl-phospholipid synthase
MQTGQKQRGSTALGSRQTSAWTASPASRAVGKVLEPIARSTEVCFRIVFADGSGFQSRDEPPAVTLFFRGRGAEWRTALFGYVGLLESYFDGSLDIEGDIAAAFRAGWDSDFKTLPNVLNVARNLWHEWRFSNGSIAQTRENARFHYDLGTDFYRYWLDDPYRMYTCAYWKEGTRTLEEAQQNKMEHICRKLGLKAGDTFVDIGSGWGGFVFYAWERHRALGTGINIAPGQVADMQREIERRGLQDKLKAVEADFREIPGEYDKCVSIGVLEHAGRDQLREVIRAHAACLKPGGLGLLHFIGHVGEYNTEFYIRKHIFPGGWIPGLAQTLAEMERAGLEILDVENLRRHYAPTLDEWARRFEEHWPEIHALRPAVFDERFRRKWRTYLHSCAEMFRSKNSYTHLFQIVYSRGNVDHRHPMSRAHVYGPESGR